ncbi:hypothetical protein POUND7_003372 [Theobroma cacao]
MYLEDYHSIINQASSHGSVIKTSLAPHCHSRRPGFHSFLLPPHLHLLPIVLLLLSNPGLLLKFSHVSHIYKILMLAL